MARTRLDWRSGGLLLGLAVLLVLAAAGWRATWMLRGAGATGDDAPGFSLDGAIVPAARIVESGVPRDGIPAIVDPPSMPAAGVAEVNERHRGKYLVGDDLVVGVALGGEARAYPIRVLDWHEAVNDTLGGVPILVTRSPLTLSAAVYERRSPGGAAREFGISGLLLQSNTLLYDRTDGDLAPSLWAQLDGLAVAGPAAGRRLAAVPASLVRWSDWTRRHPGTTVLEPDPDRLKRYQRNPYGSYRSRGEPRFPVDPPPPEDGPPTMAPLVLLGERAWRLPEAVDAPRRLTLDDTSIELSGAEPPLSVLVDGPAPLRYGAWFAVHARNPSGSAPGPLPATPN